MPIHPATQVILTAAHNLRRVIEDPDGIEFTSNAQAQQYSDAIESLGFAIADFTKSSIVRTQGQSYTAATIPVDARAITAAAQQLARAARDGRVPNFDDLEEPRPRVSMRDRLAQKSRSEPRGA